VRGGGTPAPPSPPDLKKGWWPVTQRNKAEVKQARDSLGKIDLLERMVVADLEKFSHPPGLVGSPASPDAIRLHRLIRLSLYSGPDGTLVADIQSHLDALGLPDKIEDHFLPTAFSVAQPRFSLSLFPQLKTLRRKLEIIAEGGSGDPKITYGEQPWSDNAPEYLPNSDALKLVDGEWTLNKLGKLLVPHGRIRYMRKGQRTKVHVQDFLQEAKVNKGGTPTEGAIEEAARDLVAGVERRKKEEAQRKVANRSAR
jgi:hypothetical protein